MITRKYAPGELLQILKAVEPDLTRLAKTKIITGVGVLDSKTFESLDVLVVEVENKDAQGDLAAKLTKLAPDEPLRRKFQDATLHIQARGSDPIVVSFVPSLN